jgi:RNA polymerase sigma factor (sigma-70 family)
VSISQLAVTHDPTSAYRRLVTALARRAARLGSADPESAAQEAVKRSLAAPASRPALEYYFHETADTGPPEWSLLQLFGWLHGVLRFVVREERARVRSHRETPAADVNVEPADTGPDQLESVIDAQLRGLVIECLKTLNADYRSALLLRWDGVKYVDIARRLGVNENTVATWLRRGSHELTQLVRERMNTGRPADEEGDRLEKPRV